jgi:Cu+-exporting ATPase
MSQMMKSASAGQGQQNASIQTFTIEGMHCGSCVARIEAGLKKAFSQLTDVRVNLATGQALLEGDVSPAQVVDEVRKLGYQARFQESVNQKTEGSSTRIAHAEMESRSQQASRQALGRLVTAIGLTAPLFAIHMLGLHFAGSGWVQFALATPVLFYCGWSIFSAAFQMLCRGQSNMDTLIALGSGVAWLASVKALLKPHPLMGHADLYFETAAMIVTLILLGRYLEARARARAGEAIEALLRLQPETALCQQNGNWVEVPVAQVQLGDTLLVRPGGRIPLDGVVIDGEAQIDESMMTGESLPIHKKPGDSVIGGTLNQSGSLTLKVSQVGEQTMLARIITLVGEAQTGKPPIQRFADKVAGIFVPVVLVLAILTLLGWVFTGHSAAQALNATVAVLVIACPCALGLATPTAIQVGLGRAASQGILIRKPEGLELAQSLQVLVMDKTGTLTLGQPEVIRFEARSGFATEDCLRWAAAVEARSEHPLARAVVAYAEMQGLPVSDATLIQHFTSQAGAGVSAQVEGRRILIGKPDYLALHGVVVSAISDQLDLATRRGKTPVLLAVENQLAGYFLIADPLKPGVTESIHRLRVLGIQPVMLSGDRQETAQTIGRQAGLRSEEILADVSPQEKLDFVKRLQQASRQDKPVVVGMVGDGINDAPALAQADVSIAIGTGTDIAMQTAQITLVHGDIAKVVESIELSRAILRTIRQNLFWAFFYNLVALPVAALGWLNPMIAAGAMALSSVTVVLNSLRLRRV